MFLGHVGLALAAKRVAPRVSLGTLLIAATLLDGIWAILLPAGLDREGIGPVLMAAVRPDFATDAISHGLPAAGVLALLFGVAFFASHRSARGALVVAALVLSHWLLDAPGRFTHVVLWPGTAALPLRGSLPLLLVLESALFFGGVVVYLRATRARDPIGSYGLGVVLVGLLAVFAIALLQPHPLEVHAFFLAALGTGLFAPLGFWIERHRVPAHPLGPEALAARLGARTQGLALGMFL